MANCKKCNRETAPNQPICDLCIGNWLVMREVIQNRLKVKYGEPTHETGPAIQREVNRLDALWKRDRDRFKNEVNAWYEKQ